MSDVPIRPKLRLVFKKSVAVSPTVVQSIFITQKMRLSVALYLLIP